MARQMDRFEQEREEPDRGGNISPVSSRSRASTTSRSSAGSRVHQGYRKPPQKTIHPGILDNTRLTVNDLRLQMLRTIFGWHDEISRHPQGAPQRLLLAKWIGDIDPDIMANSSESMTSADWMLLALSGIGGTASQAKVARAYVQRLLEKGDVHTAATILIGMGDQNDAIEVYVSHKRYMEAVILTCLVYPADWSRQAELVKKWGGWAVQHKHSRTAQPSTVTSRSTRPSNRSVLNTPASARTATPGGFSRQRLPSIGEMPSDVVIPRRHLEPIKLSTPADSGSDRENKAMQSRTGGNASHPANLQLNSATYDPISRASTASPMMEKARFKLQPLPSPSPESFNRLQKSAANRQRNGSRTRKPEDLTLNWPPMESIVTGDYMTSPDPSVASSRVTTASRSVAGSVASSTRSPVASERSYRSDVASPVVTGRSIDEVNDNHHDNSNKAATRKQSIKSKILPEYQQTPSRSTSRRPSPGRVTMIDTKSARGRSQGREGSGMRSPSSPLPMSPQAKFYQDEDDEDLRRAHEDQMRFRETRSRNRSTSRMRDRSTARQESPERRRRDRSSSRRPTERDASRARREPSVRPEKQTSHVRSMSQMSRARSVSGRDAGDLNLVKDARTLKKEQAARELEERRKSLALRPMAPPIVHPEEIATLSPISYRRQQSPELHRSLSRSSQHPPRSQTSSPAYHKDGSGSAVQVGLPATPKAMKHPKYDPEGDVIPDVPSIPEKAPIDVLEGQFDTSSTSATPSTTNFVPATTSSNSSTTTSGSSI
ncbi:hypothetical protein M7I_3148 [Glarea lozoyensis 74030]|uniref:Gem-associated protein 5 TPR domain-containing protein n=1 Tax=Glarea lozoyensis (strain ATCC 74030 / MF5533) TaxID=1104152 RepID=H0EKR9_GLAL7|nr:hypothetical protein M7I_3148 [Glarea lozoyensis 74030]